MDFDTFSDEVEFDTIYYRVEDQENRYCLCNDAFFEYVYPYLEELDKLAQKYTKLKPGYIDFKLDENEIIYEDENQVVISKEDYLKHKDESFYLFFDEDE